MELFENGGKLNVATFEFKLLGCVTMVRFIEELGSLHFGSVISSL